MADYIVREEDGTSKLTVEDASGSLLLEDGGLYGSVSAAFVFGATFTGTLPVRLTQEGVEVLFTDPSAARVTQEGVEVLFTDPSVARLTQEGVEVLRPVGGYVPDPPPNNLFANAEALAGSSGSATEITTWNEVQPAPYGYATQDGAYDPLALLFHDYGKTTVWFTWTAPADGYLTLITSAPVTGTPIGDTVIGIYTGAALGSLTELAFNDDYAGSPYARLDNVPVTNGVTYMIEVTGFSDTDAGAFQLTYEFTTAPIADTVVSFDFHLTA